MAGDPNHQTTWGLREFLGYWESPVDASSFRKRKFDGGPRSTIPDLPSPKARRTQDMAEDLSEIHKLSREELIQRVQSLTAQLQNAKSLITQLQERNMDLQKGLSERLTRTVEDTVRRSLADIGRCPSARGYYGATDMSLVSPATQGQEPGPLSQQGGSSEFFPGTPFGSNAAHSSSHFSVPSAVCAAQLAHTDEGPTLSDYLTDDEIRYVNEATTYTRLICHLMAALFTRDEMATSSVTGKTTKGVTTQQLDPQRTSLVIRHTQQRFPGTSILQIRAKMAQKCKDCRTTMRKKAQLTQMKVKDDKSSSILDHMFADSQTQCDFGQGPSDLDSV